MTERDPSADAQRPSEDGQTQASPSPPEGAPSPAGDRDTVPTTAQASGREAKIVGLLCNWCTYAGADLAGTTRIKYPQNMRPIRIPCSGRVSPHFLFTSLFQGADGVFVGGCHPADCHYTTGNYYARRRFALMKSLLGFIGVEPERLALEWVSASEGDRFAEVVTAFTEGVKKLGKPSALKRDGLEK